jgi:hypothetical protein
VKRLGHEFLREIKALFEQRLAAIFQAGFMSAAGLGKQSGPASAGDRSRFVHFSRIPRRLGATRRPSRNSIRLAVNRRPRLRT